VVGACCPLHFDDGHGGARSTGSNQSGPTYFGNYEENWRGKRLWKKVWRQIEESKGRDP